MNTLYDILEVSEKASKEVIEKAYRVLAKKYHPDLQTTENKVVAEKKMKEINEAYSILSDEYKRKEYDESLLKERQIKEQENNIQYEKSMQTNYQSQSQPVQNVYYTNNTQQEQRYRDMQRRKYEEQLRKQQEQMQRNMQEQYENAYYNYLRSLGYRIKERWTWEKTKKLIITLLIMLAIITILWFIPPTHKMMVNFYETNHLVKIVVDIILGTIVAIFETIKDIFCNIFS